MAVSNFAPLVISLISAAISLTTLWFSVLHRGSIKMTRPRLVALLRGDGPVADAPKIFMRMLLFSTGKRGQTLESLFVKVHQKNSAQLFLFWGYGDTSELRVGSGLFIGPDGHVANHHFLLLPDSAEYRFKPGELKIEIHGTIAGRKRSSLLHSVHISLPENAAQKLIEDPAFAIHFNWDPEARLYRPHHETRPPKQRTHSVSGSGLGPARWT